MSMRVMKEMGSRMRTRTRTRTRTRLGKPQRSCQALNVNARQPGDKLWPGCGKQAGEVSFSSLCHCPCARLKLKRRKNDKESVLPT